MATIVAYLDPFLFMAGRSGINKKINVCPLQRCSCVFKDSSKYRADMDLFRINLANYL